MKDFLKKHSLLIAIAAAIIFLTVFLSFLFKKTGDTVYIVETTGEVSVGSTDDLNNLKDAETGMKLSVNDIILTGDKSSCVLAYDKKATAKSNFINIGENSQIMIYSKNKGGGHNFFITYGSAICNMAGDESYKVYISSKLFSMYADNTITKATYNTDENMSKVYTFDGNPQLQVVQGSGTMGTAEKLLKNSVCAIKDTGNGTIGFGYLNVSFELNELTAQDLKTMSGIASNWADKLSYGQGEFEQAYQDAEDKAKWTATNPVEITTVTEQESVTPSEEVTYDVSEIITSDEITDIVTTYETDEYIEPVGTRQTLDPNSEIYYTAFARQTVTELTETDVSDTDISSETEEETSVTTVPETSNTDRTSRTTTAYHEETIVPETTGKTVVTTVPDETTYRYSDINPAPDTINATAPVYNTTHETSSAYNTGTKPEIVTTVPTTVVDTNAVFTVIFSYKEGETEYWSVQLVRYGQSAVAPSEPDVTGKTFKGWDKDYTCITANTEITAVFDGDGKTAVTGAKDMYTVRFYVENKLWKTVTVKRGGTAKVAGKPVSSDKTLEFCGWSDSLDDIRSDKIVFALFTTKQ